jgi:FMN-dependent NADH-azoreductase
MTPTEVTAWEKIRGLASRFQRSDRIVMGGADVEFLLPLKAEATDRPELSAQYAFTFDGRRYGPSLDVEKALVAFVRGQSDEAGFETVS